MEKTSENDFRIMIVKTIQDLEKTMEKMQEMFTKDLGELKNKQIEMNNTLEGINSRITEAEEWINDLEDRMVEITATEQNIKKKKRMKKKKKLRQPKRPVQLSRSAVSDSLRPMNCNMPGLPVQHQLLELAQTHVH